MKNKLLFLGLFLVLFGGLFSFSQIFVPLDSKNKEAFVFQIEKGENLFSISENLENQKLIKNKLFFQFLNLIKFNWKELQAGEYELSPSININKIEKIIVKGRTISKKIVIPEGFTIKQIQEQFKSIDLESEIVGDYKKYEFLKDVPNKYDLQGFLFPNTYYFDPNVQSKDVVLRMLDNFDQKLDSDLRKQIENQEKSIFDIITMASLIEKEVRTWEDKQIVSGILWKRLEIGMGLQVDATITFLTGKKTVSNGDTEIDSPYNTYFYPGLPIAPICNPGLESIKAALSPVETDYLYYLSTPEGETIFSETLEKHNETRVKYLK